ncbi:MAG: helix-turn-helix domain-containing protein [Bifidobacteriaceae bacterium]|jgi:transcriptional regulator with XRE-family HTH domain|nr:helix-turn-helix domain-containing protein [Bifidobacteriaceae bacterium]
MNERKRGPKEPTWEDRLSAQVGLNIAAERRRQGLTAQQLSDKLREMGAPLARAAISQIETGHRRVSLAEALAIAAALEASPAELVFDPLAEAVEPLPGHSHVTGANASLWLAGRLDALSKPGEDLERWADRVTPEPRPAKPQDRESEIQYRTEAAYWERRLLAAHRRARELDHAIQTGDGISARDPSLPPLRSFSRWTTEDTLQSQVYALGQGAQQLARTMREAETFGYDAERWISPGARELMERFRAMYGPDGMVIFGHRLTVPLLSRLALLRRDLQSAEANAAGMRSQIEDLESRASAADRDPTDGEVNFTGELNVARVAKTPGAVGRDG